MSLQLLYVERQRQMGGGGGYGGCKNTEKYKINNEKIRCLGFFSFTDV